MCRPLNKVKTTEERVFYGLVFGAVFFMLLVYMYTLCDSNVVATFTWLQLFFIISDVFLSYMPSYTACGENLQMWITSNSPTLFVVQISASF